MKLVSKIMKIASYCLFGLIICVSLFVLTLRFLGETPSIFGYSFYYVLTESMEPEIEAGELILGQSVDPEELQVGDVVTYTGESGEMAGKIITHKIVEIREDAIITQGVANTVADPPIRQDQILSRYVATVPVAGTVFSVINSKFGFVFLIIIPLMILIVNELTIIAKAVKGDKEEHFNEESIECNHDKT